MKTILVAIFAILTFPASLIQAIHLRRHGWRRGKDGKWSKQIRYGQDNYTLNYSMEGALEEIEKDREATKWNPGNKVVQDHRDGRVDHRRTNIERRRRGLAVPWEPWMVESETRGRAME